MKNHNEKIKDIAESLLPSRADKYAAWKRRSIHQRNRRRINQALGRLEDDYLPEERIDLCEDDHARIRRMMWDRRGADNLGAFLKWAEAQTRHIEDEQEKYWHIKRMMPDNLISRHALTHLPWEPFDNPYYYGRNPYRRPAADRYTFRDALRDRINEALEHGFESRLNKQIKQAANRRGHQVEIGRDFSAPPKDDEARWYNRGVPIYERRVCNGCHNPRTLKGRDDVEAFINDLGKASYGNLAHPEWLRAAYVYFGMPLETTKNGYATLVRSARSLPSLSTEFEREPDMSTAR